MLVSVDKAMISSVLRNLITNAIKFTHLGGQVIISADKKPDELTISISDNGIGINKETNGRLFRIDENHIALGTQNEKGTGLGLILCKEFIEKHGGKLWVQSKENIGSTFYFTIPYDNESNENNITNNVALTAITGNQIQQEITGLKILIVEDDGMSEKLINKAMKIFSKEILNVTTGEEAIEACRNNPDIELVLMDIEMPGMNGYEATRHIRKFNQDVIIIAQSAHAFNGDNEKILAAGCNDSISKPINKEKLKILIEKYFKVQEQLL
jgi:CheY-like chemotaxis protein